MTMAQLTLAHISDLHAGSPYFVPTLMDRVVVELNELQPDIVPVSYTHLTLPTIYSV